MAIIRTLSLSVTANVSSFTRGLNKARKRLKSFTSFIPGANVNVGRFAAVMTAASVGALALWTKNSLEAIDAQAKLADRLGTSTESLAGLNHAANIMGSDQETLNSSMEKLAKNLGEAASGTGEAKDALERLGIPIDDILGKDPASQFGMIADKMRELGTQEEKAAAAADLFGRSGVDLLNTLDLGSEGLAKMQTEAENLGLSFDRIAAAKVENANDSLTRLKGVTSGIGNVLAIEVAPFIDSIISKTVDWATAGGGVREKVSGAIEFMLNGLGKVGDFLNLLRAGWNYFAAAGQLAIAALLTSIQPLISNLSDLGNFLGLENNFKAYGEAAIDAQIEAAKANFNQANEQFAAFQRGDASTAAAKWIQEVRDEAQRKAEEQVKKQDETNALLKQQNIILERVGENQLTPIVY